MSRRRDRGEGLALALGRGMATLLPRRLLLGLGEGLGRMTYALDRRHRRVTLQNLDAVLGDRLDPPARRRLARRCWGQLGRNALDLLAVERMQHADLERLVTWQGLEHLRQAYAAGCGVIVFSGHFGHWELTALMQGYLGYPLTLLARPLDSTVLDQALLRLRQRSGNRVQSKRGGTRVLVRELRAGRGVALVIDQDARERGIFVPFLGRPASTTSSLARLAHRCRAPAVPTFCLPLADGRYRIVYEPALAPPGDDSAATLRDYTARASARLEHWIREYPQHWMWAHRRWKTPATGAATW